jgi:geranylgeranyl diphosphate synthase, type II
MTQFDDLLNYFSANLACEIEKISKRVPKKLYEPVIYSLNMGGKRIRPVLLLTAYKMFRSDLEKALPAAFAIELFHNFTLLHDDIMDDSRLRRNLETVHIKYSNNAAILSGDAMSILSYEYITKCKSPKNLEIIDLYTYTALKICEGQQFDMDFETRNNVTVDDYINMIGLKTAILLATSLKMGALIADAPDEDAQLLFDMGYNLGLAFQLQDDLLDTFGNQRTFGKNIGGDIVSNKKTFLLINALELANNQQMVLLNKWLHTTNFDRTEKIETIKKIFSELEIFEITKKKIEYYFQVAYNCWDQLNVERERKEGLLTIAKSLMNRQN